MKKFLVVLEYELKEYLKNKTYLVFTILIALIGIAVMNLPRFVDMSGFTGVNKMGEAIENTEDDENDTSGTMIIYDENGIVDKDILSVYMPNVTWVNAANEKDVENSVEASDASAGFVVKDYTSYDYYIYNKSVYDTNKKVFDEALKSMMRQQYSKENNLNYKQMESLYNYKVASKDVVLGKDSVSNYWYSYMLVIIVFMLIILYGQMIAVSVTNEKSNRSIEVLVTTTTPNSLLFGKVIAGAIASLFQAGIVMGAILISYKMNSDLWGNMLDMVFKIPGDVLFAFAAFGLGGFLFYAFLYGAVGALVSKTEDISKSSGGLMMIIMIVYFIVLAQLTNVDGVLMKVFSYLPFSSYSAMFVRIAMGTVSLWEIILSFVILVVSIFIAGFLGARIYRMGTLRYGNPIKFSTALKELSKDRK